MAKSVEFREPVIQFRDYMDVALVQHMGNDASAVASARVSTQGINSLDSLDGGAEEGGGLIKFLMRNRHGTPFENNSMTFVISAPIFVFREFHRHRIGWSYNEWSGRYSELQPVFYIPSRDRNLVQVGKTGEYQFMPGDDKQYTKMEMGHKQVCKLAYRNYESLLRAGIAKEVARMTLPLNIYSTMYATCNARSMMAFLGLRTNRADAMFPSKPQREIEMVAEQMEEHFAELFPIVHEAFNQYGRVTP